MASDLVRWGVACGGGAFGNAFSRRAEAWADCRAAGIPQAASWCTPHGRAPQKAEELGARELHIGAQVQAQGFYEKFGFHTCGEPVYMDVHIPHVDMVRHLSGEA